MPASAMSICFQSAGAAQSVGADVDGDGVGVECGVGSAVGEELAGGWVGVFDVVGSGEPVHPLSTTAAASDTTMV